MLICQHEHANVISQITKTRRFKRPHQHKHISSLSCSHLNWSRYPIHSTEDHAEGDKCHLNDEELADREPDPVGGCKMEDKYKTLEIMKLFDGLESLESLETVEKKNFFF